MKYKVLLIILTFCFNAMSQDDVKKYVYYGNAAYHSENYDEAMSYYEKAILESPFNYKANYNMANTYFKLKDFENAKEKYETLTNQTNDPLKKAYLYHNIGNCLMSTNKLEDAIEAYKSSLRLNPFSEETRYNLAYALELKKQKDQQQNQQNKQDQQKNNQGGDSQNNANNNQDHQNSNGNNDEQNSQNSDNNSNEQPNQSESEQNSENNSESDGNQSQQLDENSEQNTSRKNALKILEEANEKEKKVQEMMIKSKNGKNTNNKNNSNSSKKDW